MKSILVAAALAGLLGSVSAPANAFPLVTGQVTIANDDVTEVGWRCGPFRHFDWRIHRCVWNHRRY